jgi:hypothetical protein
MNASEKAISLGFVSKMATIVNLFQSKFTDATPDLTPWLDDPMTRATIDPDSIDVCFHFSRRSRTQSPYTMLLQIRLQPERGNNDYPLRNKFFTDTDRQHSISSSVLDYGWIERVQLAATDKALMFVAEGVLMYLSEAQVKQLIATLIDRFPGCQFAFDSMAPLIVKNQKRHDALKLFEARFDWSINDLADLTDWNPQYRVLKTIGMCDLTQHYLQRMSLFNRLMMLFPPFANAYRLALTQLG